MRLFTQIRKNELINSLRCFSSCSALLILLCSSITVNSQHNYFTTSIEYTTENGLGGRFANFTYKDSRGLIWLGTQYGGLHRFDGRDFKIFNEDNGLPFNQVMEIYEDSEGWLWLYRSCYKKDKAYCFKELAFIHHITHEILTFKERFGENPPFVPTDIEDIISNPRNGDICIVTASTAYVWTAQDGFRILPSNSIDKRPYVFTILDDGRMGAYYINKSQFSYYLIDKSGKILKQELLSDGRFSTNRIYVQGENYRNVIYVGNANLPGYLHNVETFEVDNSGKLQLYQPHELLKKVGLNGAGRHIYFDEQKQAFWDASGKGFLVSFVQKRRFKQAFLQNRRLWIDKLYPLRDGEIHYGRGIYNYKTRINKHIADNTYFPFSKSDFRTAKQSFTFKGGRTFLIENDEVVSSTYINSFFSHSLFTINHIEKVNQDYWFCTESGLWTYDTDTDTYKKYDKVNGFENFLTCVVHDFIHFEADKYWVITDNGLFLLSISEGILTNYSSTQDGGYYIPSDNIYHLAQMEDSILWLATFNGLVHLSPNANKPIDKDQQYQWFTAKDGLPTNILASLFPDKHGFLWIATAKGLVQMNLESKKMKTYTKRDGLELDFFMEHAHYQAPDGELFFGGLSGFVHFHPDDFVNETFETADLPLIIVDFEQYNKSLEKFETKTASILKDYKITLSPDARLFNIRVALADYQYADDQKFAYRIKGYQDEWLEGKSNLLRISGLPYGKHEMEIRGRLADGRYSSHTITLSIDVLSPFYLRWWFILLVIASLVSAIFLWYRNLSKRQAILEKTVEDRTAQIRADKQVIENQAKELRNLDKVKSRFFANVSHELRTPLTLILSPIGSALKRNRLDNKDFTLLKLAQKSGQNLLSLINEILDLSKLESGKLELTEEPTVLYLLFKRIASSFESLAERQKITFQFNFYLEKEMQVLLDIDKFQKIVNNLLSNAFKFTPKGGQVTLTLSDQNRYLQLKVTDTGKGISSEDLAYIFDRFYQTKNPKEAAQGGTGIGLALCKEFSKLFKGKLWAKSKIGQGSSFYFEFPKKELLQSLPTEAALSLKNAIDSMPSPKAPLDSLEQQPSINSSLKSSATILLVEDNHSLRDYLKMILKEHYQVLTANNGEEAIKVLSSTHPSKPLKREFPPASDFGSGDLGRRDAIKLIISDVMMPIMDGFQLLEKLKASDDWRHIPVVMLTARAELGDRLHALRIGVDDYLTKPFEEEELLTRVANLLNNVEERANWQKNISSNFENQPETEKVRPVLSKEDAEWLQNLEAVVKNHLSDTTLNVERLAEMLFLSRRQLHRRIKQLTGLSPIQYLQEARLQEARHLLESRTKSSIKSVRAAIGVKDPKHFVQQFKKRFGKTPSEFF